MKYVAFMADDQEGASEELDAQDLRSAVKKARTWCAGADYGVRPDEPSVIVSLAVFTAEAWAADGEPSWKGTQEFKAPVPACSGKKGHKYEDHDGPYFGGAGNHTHYSEKCARCGMIRRHHSDAQIGAQVRDWTEYGAPA